MTSRGGGREGIVARYWVDGSDTETSSASCVCRTRSAPPMKIIRLAREKFLRTRFVGRQSRPLTVRFRLLRRCTTESIDLTFVRRPPSGGRRIKQPFPSPRGSVSSSTVPTVQQSWKAGRWSTDFVGDAKTGAPIPGQPTEVWDVNGAPNDATSSQISLMPRTNPDVSALFSSLGIANPYSAGTGGLWDDIAFVQDTPALPSSAKTLLIAKIVEAIHARSLGFLWYIRSGDLKSRLNVLPGGQNLSVRANWSVLNAFGTQDGLPSMVYEREGRRISAVYDTTIQDLCPTYGVGRDSGRQDLPERASKLPRLGGH